MTTSFVMATFAEWFANSTFDTVRKNLRTTTGRHKIEIDENILGKVQCADPLAKLNLCMFRIIRLGQPLIIYDIQ